MRKSDAIISRLKGLKFQLEGIDGGVQYKISDRVVGRLSDSRFALREHNSLVDLVEIIIEEVQQVKIESNSF